MDIARYVLERVLQEEQDESKVEKLINLMIEMLEQRDSDGDRN